MDRILLRPRELRTSQSSRGYRRLSRFPPFDLARSRRPASTILTNRNEPIAQGVVIGCPATWLTVKSKKSARYGKNRAGRRPYLSGGNFARF